MSRAVAGSPAFSTVLRSVLGDTSPDWAEELDRQYGALLEARIIRIEWEQMEALPEWSEDEMLAYAEQVKLPFEAVFLDSITPWQPIGPELWEDGSNAPTSFRLLGVLAWVDSGRHFAAFTPWWEFRGGAMDGRPIPERVLPFMRTWARDGNWRGKWCDPRKAAATSIGEAVPEDDWLATVSRIGAEWGLRIVAFLESANVSLVETPLSRQARRSAKRKGEEVALTVKVREPRRSMPRGGRVEYSHRFEVRGHYAHFTRGPIFDGTPPEDRAYVPGVGECRKVWIPPHVKGPASRPFVPKLRVIE